MQPVLPDADALYPYIRRIDLNGRYSNFGPLVNELEEQYSLLLGIQREKIVTVSNATLGLMGAFLAQEVEEWFLPSYTFAATAHAALSSGSSIHFLDISEGTWMIDMEGSPTSTNKGICPVIPFGASVDLRDWFHHRKVVIDAAASIGNPPVGLSEIPSDWAVVFSLHATKVLPAGEGGIVVFGNADQASRFRRWTNFGFNADRVSTALGINAKMSELTAACALASLDDWELERQQWGDAHRFATEISRKFDFLPRILSGEEISPYWIAEFSTQMLRDEVEKHLNNDGVETRRWWGEPLPQVPAFARYGANRSFPVADNIAGRLLGLPMSRRLRDSDFESVASSLSTILAPTTNVEA